MGARRCAGSTGRCCATPAAEGGHSPPDCGRGLRDRRGGRQRHGHGRVSAQVACGRALPGAGRADSWRRPAHVGGPGPNRGVPSLPPGRKTKRSRPSRSWPVPGRGGLCALPAIRPGRPDRGVTQRVRNCGSSPSSATSVAPSLTSGMSHRFGVTGVCPVTADFPAGGAGHNSDGLAFDDQPEAVGLGDDGDDLARVGSCRQASTAACASSIVANGPASLRKSVCMVWCRFSRRGRASSSRSAGQAAILAIAAITFGLLDPFAQAVSVRSKSLAT
jgi:hypothetical protein